MIDFKKAAILATIASSALVLSACNLYKTSSTNDQTGTTATGEQQPAQSAQTTESAATITFTDSGVSPATVTVKAGDSITWTNNGSKKVSVASDNHPTHTLNQELTNGQFVTELAPRASVTVTLTKVGTWGYHNHLDLSVKGKVVVQ